jgi:SAM-dependent methyltransferase
MAKAAGRPLTVLDLGSGNGWLSHRVALAGHHAVALDIREDGVDGLGAAEPFVTDHPERIERLVASFDVIPLQDRCVDLTVFNASLHYATDLQRVLGEARRVTRPDGRIAILDSPFYRQEVQGLAMVAEKRRRAADLFGDRADRLLALPFIEFLTRERLMAAQMGIAWRRHRVVYPLAYELRPLRALLRGERARSRFDLWVGLRR